MGLFSSLFGKKEENKNVEGNKKNVKSIICKSKRSSSGASS